MNDRHYDIDWLRVLAMLTIFLFHCARFFDYGYWHVKNNQLDLGLSVFAAVVSQWIMPLFFVLSAISAYYALGCRTDKQYIVERCRRLLIPLVFGTLVLIPPQVWIERVSHQQFSGSLFQFLPQYFKGFYGFGGNFAWNGLHLWYLEFLFIFSILTLPLFRYLRSRATQRPIGRLGRIGATGAAFWPIVPLIVVELIVSLQPEGIGRRDFGGRSLPTYLVFFILGFLIGGNEWFRQSIERHRVVALTGGAITTGVGYIMYTSGYSSVVISALLRALCSWLWLVAILGFGFRSLNFNNRFLRYANEAVLPFYILHQTVIVIAGFFIANWNVAVMLKYLIIVTVSFAVIAVLYELAIRRIQLLRFLFGMKRRQEWSGLERVVSGLAGNPPAPGS